MQTQTKLIDETEHIIDLCFQPVTYRRTERTEQRNIRIDTLTKQTTLWGYIPSPLCVVQVFSTNYNIANKVIDNLLRIKRGWKEYTCKKWERIQHIRQNRRAKIYNRHYLDLTPDIAEATRRMFKNPK